MTLDSDRSGDEADEERRLAALAQAGDLAAFDALVRTYLRPAFSVAYRVMGQREDAEDLVQDAFTLAFERLHTLDTTRPFRAWFFRILVNRGIDLRRARTLRHTDPLPSHAQATTSSPEAAAAGAEWRQRLLAAMGDLSDVPRLIVTLADGEGMTSREIGEMLDLPAGTVRWHLSQARRTLRAALARFREVEGSKS